MNIFQIITQIQIQVFILEIISFLNYYLLFKIIY